jgi:soluble lytic murein transglycosylase-like protein
LASNSALATQIYNQALASGVPPSIALAVAQQESGVQQWTPSGNLVTGSAGEIGVFQLMPATAAGLNVDPTDVSQNVSGGISLLAQLYQKFGNWTAALSAYNSGSPTRSTGYANSVLALAGGDPDLVVSDSVDSSSGGSGLSIDSNTLIIGGLVALGLVLWWMAE